MEKEKHPTAVLAASSAGEDEERGDSEDGASYDHEEISEDSEDVEDYEPETGIQVRRQIVPGFRMARLLRMS